MSSNDDRIDPTREIEQTGPTEPGATSAQDAERTETLDTTLLGPDEPDAASAPVAPAGSGADTQEWPPPQPARPTGLHLPPLVLGLVCLAVAGLALWQELGDVSIDWGDIGPLGIVAVGGVLVLLGLVGLATSRRKSAD